MRCWLLLWLRGGCDNDKMLKGQRRGTDIPRWWTSHLQVMGLISVNKIPEWTGWWWPIFLHLPRPRQRFYKFVLHCFDRPASTWWQASSGLYNWRRNGSNFDSIHNVGLSMIGTKTTSRCQEILNSQWLLLTLFSVSKPTWRQRSAQSGV